MLKLMDGLLQCKSRFKVFSACLLVVFLFLNSSALGVYSPFIEIGGAKHWSRLSSASTSYDLFIPLLQSDNSIIFTDLRIFNHTGKSFEGNAHLGYRYLVDDKDIMCGIYISFDRRQTDYGNWFSQITAGAELWINRLFIGLNLYQPIGKSSRDTYSIQSIGNRVFDIPSVAVTTKITTHQHREKALYGTDAELGYAFTDSLTGYVGGYYFHSSNATPIAGSKVSITYNYQRSHGKIFGILDSVNVEAGVQHDKPRGALTYISIKTKIGLDKSDSITSGGFNKHMVDLVRRDRDIVYSQEIHPSTSVHTKVELPTPQDVIEAFKIDTRASVSSVIDQLALVHYYLSDKKLYSNEAIANKAISIYTSLIYGIASSNSLVYSGIKRYITSYQSISAAMIWMDIKSPIESIVGLECNTIIQSFLLKSAIVEASNIPKNIEDFKRFRRKILAMYSPNRYNHTIKDTKLFVEWEGLFSSLMDKLINSKSPCKIMANLGYAVINSPSSLQVHQQSPYQYWPGVHGVHSVHKNHTSIVASTSVVNKEKEVKEEEVNKNIEQVPQFPLFLKTEEDNSSVVIYNNSSMSGSWERPEVLYDYPMSTDTKSSELMSVKSYSIMFSPNSTPALLTNCSLVDVVDVHKFFIDVALKDNPYPVYYATAVGFIATATSYYFVSEFFKSLASPTVAIAIDCFPYLAIVKPIIMPVLAFGYSVTGRSGGKLSEMLIENKEITKEVLIETGITNAITDSNLAGRIDNKGVFSSVWLKVDVKFCSALAKGYYKGLTKALVLTAFVRSIDTLIYFGGTYTITQKFHIVSNNKLSVSNPTYLVHMLLRGALKAFEFVRSYV